MSTIFTQIIRRELPAEIVYEDEHCMAIRDIQPQAPVHILVFPKKEIVSMADLEIPEDGELIGHLFMKASQIAASEDLADAGYRLVVNTNDDGGQTVPHLHIHILGGKALKSGFA